MNKLFWIFSVCITPAKFARDNQDEKKGLSSQKVIAGLQKWNFFIKNHKKNIFNKKLLKI